MKNLLIVKVQTFEKSISEMGQLTPLEVKLEKNQVKWFICEDSRTNELVVFDCHGYAFITDKAANDVEKYDIRYSGTNILVNGSVALRSPLFDLWDLS